MTVVTAERIGLRAARMFDGVAVVERATLLVEGEKVITVGDAIPDSVRVIDLAGATVLPGLIDTHQHLCFDGRGTLEEQVVGADDDTLLARSKVAARRALAGGVTTLRDLGDRNWLTLSLRDDPSLPTIVAAGTPITSPNGHCWYLGGGCNPDHESLKAAVSERADRGCDVVKIMVTGGALTPSFPIWKSQFAREQIRVMVDEAHRHGLPVAAHCHGIDGIRDSLDACVDSIEHCTFLGKDGRPVFDQDLFERIAASSTSVSIGFGRSPDFERPLFLAAIWDDLSRARSRLHDLGATMVAGTDAGITLGKPHDVLPTAFEEFLGIGFGAAEALRAMTSDAAHVCGVSSHKGRLAPGFDADFVAVSSDPLGGSRQLTISGVWKGGRQIL